MSPRTKKQYDDIRKQKKKLIMDTALDLFANEGYYTTSISKIAQKAGIAKGLIYNYFSSKEKLVLEIANRGIEKLIRTFDPDKDGMLTDKEFKFFINENFRMLKENHKYWKLIFAIIMQPAVHHIVIPKYNHLINYYLEITEKYYKEKGYENPKMQAMILGAFIDGISLNYIMNPDAFPIEEIKDYIIKHYTKSNQS